MKIEAISSKEVTARGKRVPVYSFKCDDGQWYSTGFKQPMLNKGDEVEFEFESTTFGNQVKFETIKINGSAAPTPSKPSFPRPQGAAGFGQRPFPIPLLHGDRAIIRQSALKAAVDLIANGYIGEVTGGKTMEEVSALAIKLARQFEAYSAGDVERMKAEGKDK